jgi:glycosyltransferase involved in cell wall biosynthesis
MRVTAVVAVRNGALTLAEALGSIAAQERPADEVIVVDGHSEDRTAAIAKAHPGVRYLLQDGRGIGAAYNQGIEAAGGDLLAFLSHDDVWTADKLAVQAGFMESNPELLYTIAHFRFVLEGPLPAGFRAELLEDAHPGRIMETLVARRDAFDTVGRFDTSMQNSEDVDWFARAGDLGAPMAVLPDVLLHKRVSPEGLTLTSGHGELFRALRRSAARKREGRSDP